MNESTFGVHKIKLGICNKGVIVSRVLGRRDVIRGRTETVPGSGNGGGVGQHAQTATDSGQVTARDVCGGLIADAELESGRTPIYDLDGLPCLDGGDGCLDILGNDITTVE